MATKTNLVPISTQIPFKFDQKTHEEAVNFLQSFDPKALLNPSPKTHTVQFTGIKTPNIVASIVFGAISAYLFTTAKKTLALAFGAVSIITIITGRKPAPLSEAEKKISQQCEETAFHLAGAFFAKAAFMTVQVNGQKNGWAFEHDAQLSTQYDKNNDEHIDQNAIPEEVKVWRSVHPQLVQLATALKFDSIDAKHRLYPVIDKLIRAKNVILTGRTPIAPENADPKEKTYVQYINNNQAASWNSPKTKE